MLPRQTEIVREFARHMAADAKVLHEDEQTGAQEYLYEKPGTNHFGMAFTYDCLAAMRADYAELPLIDFGGPPRGGGGLWIPFGDGAAGMGLFR